jgi:hypothetical protein
MADESGKNPNPPSVGWIEAVRRWARNKSNPEALEPAYVAPENQPGLVGANRVLNPRAVQAVEKQTARLREIDENLKAEQ